MYKISTYALSPRRMALATLCLASLLASAAPASAAPSIAAAGDQLVADALGANLELAASQASVEQRFTALDQARARYLPALDLTSRYTRASGGRSIDVPVGDLLNPVYATLNQLTGTSQFPAIANQRIDLQRTHE